METFLPVLHSSLLPPWNLPFREHELNFLQRCQVCANGLPSKLPLINFCLPPSFSLMTIDSPWNDFLIFSPLEMWSPRGLRARRLNLTSGGGKGGSIAADFSLLPPLYWHFRGIAELPFVSIPRCRSHALVLRSPPGLTGREGAAAVWSLAERSHLSVT